MSSKKDYSYVDDLLSENGDDESIISEDTPIGSNTKLKINSSHMSRLFLTTLISIISSVISINYTKNINVFLSVNTIIFIVLNIILMYVNPI